MSDDCYLYDKSIKDPQTKISSVCVTKSTNAPPNSIEGNFIQYFLTKYPYHKLEFNGYKLKTPYDTKKSQPLDFSKHGTWKIYSEMFEGSFKYAFLLKDPIDKIKYVVMNYDIRENFDHLISDYFRETLIQLYIKEKLPKTVPCSVARIKSINIFSSKFNISEDKNKCKIIDTLIIQKVEENLISDGFQIIYEYNANNKNILVNRLKFDSLIPTNYDTNINKISKAKDITEKINNFLDKWWAKSSSFFNGFFKSLNELHKINVFHSDLSESNVLYKDDNSFKFIDFGFSVNVKTWCELYDIKVTDDTKDLMPLYTSTYNYFKQNMKTYTDYMDNSLISTDNKRNLLVNLFNIETCKFYNLLFDESVVNEFNIFYDLIFYKLYLNKKKEKDIRYYNPVLFYIENQKTDKKSNDTFKNSMIDFITNEVDTIRKFLADKYADTILLK